MARTSETVTQQEIQSYVKFCRDYNVVNYDGRDPETLANADFILNYFLEVWKQDMTEANFAQAFPQLKPHLKFYGSPQHAEFTHIANENIHAAQQLSGWLATQGKPGQLANQGDEAYENLALLLTELRNRREDVLTTTIRNGIDRISNRPGRKLHYVEAPRRSEPVSRLAKEDAEYSIGKPFSNSDLVKTADGSLRSKTPAEQRRDMEAAERAKSQPQTTTLDASEQTWKAMAGDSLNVSGPHSLRDRVRQIYDREQGQGSWRHVYEAVQREINIYKSKNVR
jgi:hypothetical protein